jgi:putative membrane protein
MAETLAAAVEVQMKAYAVIPYCGAPPLPGHVTWNSDPVLAFCLLIFALLYGLGIRRRPIETRWQVCFWSGWAILTLALVSPLCNLSVALFSARIAQHVILTLLAAPLLVFGRVERIFAIMPSAWIERASGSVRKFCAAWSGQWVAVVAFALAMWLWHVPGLYDATFESTLIYWTMHVTMIGAALLLWAVALRGSGSIAGGLFAIFATMLQMSLLGAVLTFAGSPLFAVHADTTWPWGLSQLADQEFGGLVMWVIGGVLLAGYAVFILAQYIMEGAHVEEQRA